MTSTECRMTKVCGSLFDYSTRLSRSTLSLSTEGLVAGCGSLSNPATAIEAADMIQIETDLRSLI